MSKKTDPQKWLAGLCTLSCSNNSYCNVLQMASKFFTV